LTEIEKLKKAIGPSRIIQFIREKVQKTDLQKILTKYQIIPQEEAQLIEKL
jgi:hypothetical protein